jgi:hypothetical protein
VELFAVESQFGVAAGTFPHAGLPLADQIVLHSVSNLKAVVLVPVSLKMAEDAVSLQFANFGDDVWPATVFRVFVKAAAPDISRGVLSSFSLSLPEAIF